MTEAVIVAVIGGFFTLIGVLISNSSTRSTIMNEMEKKQAITDTKLEELTREVRAHNNFAQRVPTLEEQMKSAFKRIEHLEGSR